ncbi:MAG: thioesterase family protein [Bacteroidota bacterium]|jgi:acyl-CoA thioester hydrolase
MTSDLSKFKHTYQIRVRNYEIDWQGIVHNGNYLLYFEVARVEYFKLAGLEIDERAITGKTKIVVVRNEIDYLSQATYDDELTIYTRIAAIKNSSFICEAVMIHAEKNIVVAKNVCVHAWLNPETNTASPVPTEIRKRINEFEEGNAAIQWPSIDV